MADSTSTTDTVAYEYLSVMLSAVERSVFAGHKGAAQKEVSVLLDKIKEHAFDDLPEGDQQLRGLWRMIELTYLNKAKSEMLPPSDFAKAATAYKTAAVYVRKAGYEHIAVAYESVATTILLEHAVGSIPFRYTEMVESQAATDWMERMWDSNYADDYGRAKAAQGLFHYADWRPGLGLQLFKYGRQFLNRPASKELNRSFLRLYRDVHARRFPLGLRLKMWIAPRHW